MTTQLTVLNDMASPDFPTSLQIHRDWGLEWMDLRMSIWGKRVGDLTIDDATRARAAIDTAELKVYCMSTSVFFSDVAQGERTFREQHLSSLPRIIEAAKILRPSNVRLIAALLPEREPGVSSVRLLQQKYPWIVDVYREAIDTIEAAGLHVTIENEAFGCFLSATHDFLSFFDWLDRPDVSLTWDINNQWATGTFPTLTDYEQLKPLIGYFHLKGGRANDTSDRLVWNSALEDSTYDVIGITQRVVNDNASPVICLNPSQHGQPEPGYDYSNPTKRDLDYLRARIEGIE